MNNPHKVVVKTITMNRTVNVVFDFFEDVKKSMEVGGAAKSVTKGNEDWWIFEHVIAGKAKIKKYFITPCRCSRPCRCRPRDQMGGIC